MQAIFNDIKENLEMSNIQIIDTKLLLLANRHISYLINNKIPFKHIDKSTLRESLEISDHYYYIILDYITMGIMIDINFDLLSQTSYSILKERMDDNIDHLKVVFDK